MKTIKHILIDIADNAYIAGLKRDKDSIFNLDQALKEIHDLIVESLPEEKVLKSRQTGQDMKQIMALGYHQALSDTKANLKRILK